MEESQRIEIIEKINKLALASIKQSMPDAKNIFIGIAIMREYGEETMNDVFCVSEPDGLEPEKLSLMLCSITRGAFED